MIRALFKFAKIPSGAVIVDTTSNTHPIYRELSPFVLSAPPAKRFENLWQFSKVYPHHWDDQEGEPMPEWYQWRDRGYADNQAHRYPMGKGAIPICSWWGRPRGYIEARKVIYAFYYAQNVLKTESYKILREQYNECDLRNKDMILLDYDAYDHIGLGMSLVDVINDPNKKMGHAFVLIMMLTDTLNDCLANS